MRGEKHLQPRCQPVSSLQWCRGQHPLPEPQHLPCEAWSQVNTKSTALTLLGTDGSCWSRPSPAQPLHYLLRSQGDRDDAERGCLRSWLLETQQSPLHGILEPGTPVCVLYTMVDSHCDSRCFIMEPNLEKSPKINGAQSSERPGETQRKCSLMLLSRWGIHWRFVLWAAEGDPGAACPVLSSGQSPTQAIHL